MPNVSERSDAGRLRVLFVSQTGAKPGGAEQSLGLLLTHLPPDIVPRVLFFEDGEFAARLRGAGIGVDVLDVPPALLGITRERPSTGAALAVPRVIGQTAALVRASRADLVHTNTMKAHLIGSPAARLAGVPAVMHVRDMVEGMGRRAMRMVAAACTRERIAISRALAGWYGMSHTTVIPNPVDLARYAQLPSRGEARRLLGLPDDGLPLIGIVGRINRWKGHDAFLRIVAAVNARLPVRCVIVGEARFRDADFVPELHRLADELGIGERTTFSPWQDDPRAAYAALDVHCNCSLREPFGRSIVEAAAAGAPTIAFDDGGATDIIRDGVDGRLIAAGDEAGFASALLALVSDRRLLERYATQAREGSARFAARAHADLVAAVLRRGARRGRP